MVRGENLRSGHSSSCGCLSRENCAAVGKQGRPKHGAHQSPEYRAWQNMKSRCTNPAAPGFKSEGGKGIRVDEPWLSDFEVFIADVGPRPTAKHRLSRIDRRDNYRPGNAMWVVRTKFPERRVKERERAWREANVSHLRESGRAYYRKNRDRFLLHSRNRRAKKRSSPGAITHADIEEVLNLQRWRCAYCRSSLRTEYHVDHIIPLARGGEHSRANIQATCPKCNLQKGAKDPVVFAQAIGRLI